MKYVYIKNHHINRTNLLVCHYGLIERYYTRGFNLYYFISKQCIIGHLAIVRRSCQYGSLYTHGQKRHVDRSKFQTKLLTTN